MQRKILALLCAMVMLLAVLPAQAAETSNDGMFVLVSTKETVEKELGCAVLMFNQQTLLTTVPLSEGAETLRVRNGRAHYDVDAVTALDNGLYALTLKEDADAAPLTPVKSGEAAQVLVCSGVTATLNPVESATFIPYNGTMCLLITTEKATPMGAAVLNEAGEVVALIEAGYGEGIGRYVALMSETLAAAMDVELQAATQVTAGDDSDVGSIWDGLNDGKTDEESLWGDDVTTDDAATIDGFITADEETVWLEGVSVTAKADTVLVDWSTCTVADLKDDSVFMVFWMDEMNPYYSFCEVPAEESALEIPAVPGHRVAVWVQHAHGAATSDVYLPENYALAELPASRPFNKYGYKDLSIYLGTLPAGTDETTTEEAAVLSAITAQALTDPAQDVYLQVTSKYRVKKNDEAGMLVVLTSPEGYTYTYAGTFVFDTSLSDSDSWHVNVSDLFEDHQSLVGGFAPGEYELAYYFGGYKVNSLTFTLK